MPKPIIDTRQALAAAIAANQRVQREKLVRSVRNQGIRARVALALTGCIALFALTAFYIAHDREAAEILAIITCVTFGVTLSAGRAGRKKAIDSLGELDQSL